MFDGMVSVVDESRFALVFSAAVFCALDRFDEKGFLALDRFEEAEFFLQNRVQSFDFHAEN